MTCICGPSVGNIYCCLENLILQYNMSFHLMVKSETVRKQRTQITQTIFHARAANSFWFGKRLTDPSGKINQSGYTNLTTFLIVDFFFSIKGVLHLWALFLKTLCIFSKNKATSDKVCYGSGQKCSKELENYSFTSLETIVVKLSEKCAKINIFHVLSHKSITTWVSEIPVQ